MEGYEFQIHKQQVLCKGFEMMKTSTTNIRHLGRAPFEPNLRWIKVFNDLYDLSIPNLNVGRRSQSCSIEVSQNIACLHKVNMYPCILDFPQMLMDCVLHILHACDLKFKLLSLHLSFLVNRDIFPWLKFI